MHSIPGFTSWSTVDGQLVIVGQPGDAGGVNLRAEIMSAGRMSVSVRKARLEVGGLPQPRLLRRQWRLLRQDWIISDSPMRDLPRVRLAGRFTPRRKVTATGYRIRVLLAEHTLLHRQQRR
jgi:hypothetical protein